MSLQKILDIGIREVKMSEKWYAVMTDNNDTDWGTGYFDPIESEKQVVKNLDIYPNGYIAVIENNACIEKRLPDNFSPIYYNAYKIITAHDWNECAENCKNLARWLDMEIQWNESDDTNFEKVIREMGEKIGIELV